MSLHACTYVHVPMYYVRNLAIGRDLVRLLHGSGETYAMKVLKKSEVARRKQVEHTKTERRIMGVPPADGE